MNESPPLDTVQMNLWLDQMLAGDRAASNELLRTVCGRLERLAHKMLGRFRRVGRWVDSDDVLQSALLRLVRALQQVRPASTREFFGLAAEQIRRELLDIARHYYGPHGPGANSDVRAPWARGGVDRREPADEHDLPADLERWSAFHEEVARLPAHEREVVQLIFYHGWTQEQVAELFGASERTVRRRWNAAMQKLHHTLQEGAA